MSEEFDAVRTILHEAVEAHAFPAACMEVGGHDDSRWTASVGAYTFDPYAPPATAATIFDLACSTTPWRCGFRIGEEAIAPA
jgi:hypothetical protein